jgi:NDP-hexose 4-ketoreductase
MPGLGGGITRLAVVGGRGWLGRAITDAARQAGCKAYVVSRTPGPGVVVADPEDPASVARALAGADVVVNATGYRGGDAATAHDVNVVLPRRLGRLARDEGRRLVHLGSAAEYGGPAPGVPDPAGRLTEVHPCLPTTVYGRSKLAGTRALLELRDDRAPVVVARVFNVAAPDVPADNPLLDLVTQVRAARLDGDGSVPVDVGDPTTVRDISTRAGVAHAVVALALSVGGVRHPVVNVCSGIGTAFGELTRALAGHLGVDATVRDLGWPRGGRIVGDPGLLRSLVDVPGPSGADDHLHELVISILAPGAVPVASPGGQTCSHP